jgi:hypothetical protein
MRRRELLLMAPAIIGTRASRAQQLAGVARIGILSDTASVWGKTAFAAAPICGHNRGPQFGGYAVSVKAEPVEET